MPEYAPLSVTINLPTHEREERRAHELIASMIEVLEQNELIDPDTDVTWRVIL